MTKTPLSAKATHQRQRLLAKLLSSPITTLEARQRLDIIAHWQTIDTGKAKHRIAQYVLLSGGSNG